MKLFLSRRNFIKLGTVAGISLFMGDYTSSLAEEPKRADSKANWIDDDGKVKHRWDALAKVTGQKTFSYDLRAKNIEGWPQQQAYGFFIKATKADRTFEAVDLSVLGDDLQPDRLIMHEDLLADGIHVPQLDDLGEGFYGSYFLVPKGQTPPMLGHPVALLVYQDFDRYWAAKSRVRFDTDLVKYGQITGTKLPKHYGAARYVRIGGMQRAGSSLFSPMQDGVIWGDVSGSKPVWPDEEAGGFVVPTAIANRNRAGGRVKDPEQYAREHYAPMQRGMSAAKEIEEEIAAARKDKQKIVLDRHGFSQSIEPSAMEPDNGTAWYDATTHTLHLVVATQSAYDVARTAAYMLKDNKKFPVSAIRIIASPTVGYGSKDHSVFPYYVIAAAFYGGGQPVRLANDRYEQFQLGLKRHSIDMDVTLVADRQTGRFEIMKGEYVLNGGGRANFSFSVAQVAATSAQSIYYFPKSDLAGIALASEAVEAGSMRGYGTVQAMTITELMVDELASELKMDPLHLRQINALLPGDENTQGAQPYGDLRNDEMLDAASRHPLWINRESAKKAYESENPGRLYGVGFAQVQKDYGSGADSVALTLEFDREGRLSMRHCLLEIGTGASTSQQTLVKKYLGKVPDNVEFAVTEFPELPLVSNFEPYTLTQEQQDQLAEDPHWVPVILPAMSASNSAYYLGFGTAQAARFLLEHSLWPAARAIWGEGPSGGQLSSGHVTFDDVRVTENGIGGAGLENLTIEQVAKKAHEMGLVTGVSLHCFCRWQWATAVFDVPAIGEINIAADALSVRYGDGASSELKARMKNSGYDFIQRKSVDYPDVQRNNAGVTFYAPAACIVEANVNTMTGETEIMSHHTLLDPGKIMVEALVSGQQQGGAAMGIGHALFEELPLYEDGPGDGTWNFNRYRLPRSQDVAVWSQSVEYLPMLTDSTPSKGIAEVVMIPVVAAIGNAIAHATGFRFYNLPITAEKIRKAFATQHSE